MADYSKTLTDMSRETRPSGWSYIFPGDRENRSVMLPIRVTPTEREAIRTAAQWENKSVAGRHPSGDCCAIARRFLQARGAGRGGASGVTGRVESRGDAPRSNMLLWLA